MSERKEIKVDEKYWQQMMAADAPIHRVKSLKGELPVEATTQPPEEPEPPEEPIEPPEPKRETKERKRGGVNQSDFAELFLKDNRLSDRRMVYVSKETYEKLIKYVSIVSDRKLGIVGYVDNIISHHIECYKPAINDMYESRIGCKVFKN
jgi:hypothetical protein